MTTGGPTCFMINLKCANYTIIELHDDLHQSFVSSIVVLTEIQNYACALNIPICPTSTTMVSPILHCFRQLPGTPGEADENAPDRSLCIIVFSMLIRICAMA